MCLAGQFRVNFWVYYYVWFFTCAHIQIFFLSSLFNCDLNLCSVRVTNTSRKGNLLSYSFSIVNCIDGRIEFTWSSNMWTSSWRGQRMNVSSTYLSHIDGFSNVDLNDISSKFSMYMLANTGDNGKHIASPSSCWYVSDPIPK